MARELFTEAWAEAWCRRINASEAYREAAADWEGDVVLEVSPGPGEEGSGGQDPRAVWLDLRHGECRECREATEEDRRSARYVLGAGLETWERVLAGELSPISAILRGKIELVRGRVTHLARFTSAARELVTAAERVEAPVDGAATDGTPVALSPGQRRESFRSTSCGGLDRASFPLRLWEKSKRLGIWNPSEIDLRRDGRDWQELEEGERDILLRLASLFLAGEEAVTVDLLPFLRMVAEEGRLEEEIYLTAFLWEEAKHVDAFRRFFDEVAGDVGDLSRYHTPSYRELFYRELPSSLERLAVDRSTEARARASVTYHLIVEGVLAETGYHVYGTTLEENGILPGMQELVRRVAQDESRHLAYGVYFLSGLVAEGGDAAWSVVEGRMEELLPLAVGLIREAFAAYEVVPFGLEPDDFVDYALGQFRKRMERVASARDGPPGATFELAGG